MALKLVGESEAAEIYRVCRAIEGTEKQRRLLNAERAHKITSYESKLARAAAEAPKGAMGWHVCNLPPIDFHAMVDKYGYETVHSREFLEWNMKKHPEHKVKGF